MTRRILLAVLVAASVASCARISESRLNPFNWFGRDRAVEETPDITVVPDARPFVDQVVSVSIDRTPGGAILRAVGLPPTQGYWDGELLLDQAQSTPGRLIYQFRIQQPPYVARVSTPASREVVVATFISAQRLEGVRDIQVLGARASRAVGR